ncbi:MAG: hypothetical protein ACOCVY_01175 [Patescibacteria group bacterium]
MANKKTTKKKEEEKDVKASSSKGSTAKKKTSSAKKSNSKKTSSSAKKTTGQTAKRTTKTTAGKKKASSAKRSKTEASKIKVRVTQEDISGIQEGMEEANYSKSSANSQGGEDKKKRNRTAGKTKKKKTGTSESGKRISPAKPAEKGRRKKKKESVETETLPAEEKKRPNNKNVWTSFSIGEDSGKEKKKENIKPRSISLYKKIAFTFISLTFLLLAVVFYFSAVSLKITLVSAKESINDKLILSVYDKNSESGEDISSEKSLSGIVDQLTINKSGVYQSTGEEVVGEEITGKVTIVNNYSQNQPLVASTRILSPNDKMYRLSETVTVPAGGSVEVDVYTDEPSPEYAIGPTRFTIPGLWAGLQDDIYAESKKEFEYRTEKRKFIKKEDINNAIRNIKKKLSQKGEKEFGDNYLGYDEVIYNLVSVDADTDKEAGDEAEEFKVTAEGTINVVAFNNEKLKKIAESKLYSSLPEDRELVEFNEEDVDYSLDDYNFSDKTATLEVSFSGKTVFNGDEPIIDKKSITGLNKQQLKDYLEGLDKVSDYKVDFSPAFINKVPSLVDRIEVNIEEE